MTTKKKSSDDKSQDQELEGQPPPAPEGETLDGNPPGAHAAASIGTGAPNDITGAMPFDPARMPNPEGHVDDPSISPAEQARKAQAAAGAAPVGPDAKSKPAKGMQRVRVKSGISVDGTMHMPGEVVDLSDENVAGFGDKVEPV